MSENNTSLINTETQLRYAEKILCELLGAGVSDLYAIYEMEQAHLGTIDRGFELFDEFENEKPNFGFFVLAVRDVALQEVRDIITDEDAESFQDMVIDDDFAFWGSLMQYGYYEGTDISANHERQELFAEYVRGKITKEEFAEKYKGLLQAPEPKGE
jgi:hypothetical protein